LNKCLRVALIEEIIPPLAIFFSIIAFTVLVGGSIANKMAPETFFTQSKLSFIVVLSIFIVGNLLIGREILKNCTPIYKTLKSIMLTGIEIVLVSLLLSALPTHSLVLNFNMSGATYIVYFILIFTISAWSQIYFLTIKENALRRNGLK